ncbi:fungal-specific transcription factor domain-containing protein [Ganoderma leucocontextum]|nr:fungal-specific transcription factor domain-containing protein [Ganoderma leucocontextum]
MSSQEEEPSPPQVSEPEQAKRRKKQRACDYCRRKKSASVHLYLPVYVQILENRLQNMEKLFGQLHPNVEIPKDFDGTLDSTHWRVAPVPAEASAMVSAPSPRSSASVAGVSPPPVDTPSPVDEDELDPSEDEREARLNIIENLKRLTINRNPDQMRYHGKSSNLMFLQTVIKQKYPGADRPKGKEPSAVPDVETVPAVDFPILKAARERVEQPPYRNFPPADLMEKLIDGYFDGVNIYLPLLHRPTFQNNVQDGLHLREKAFGAVLLMVCAIGSRWTDDPRVETDDGTTPGWCWFTQVDTLRWSIFERPKVEDVQACSLIASFLALSSRPQGSWTVMGLGLRMIQDVGAHRKKVYRAAPSAEDELWRRAVWVLVYLDRTASFGLGRPCGLHDEDFDLDPMTEVDDEYWVNTDSESAFKQPEGKPSKIAFANCLVRLQKILAYASRTIYSINKSKQTLGYVGSEWEQRTVAELDSALNKWIDTVPEHLKWDPNREDDIFMNQSCTLYANYYWLQICVHRPFIQPGKANRLPFPSLAICTNAARSATHVMETQFKKNKESLILNRLPLFTSGLVLLFNLWGAKRSGLSNEAAMADVHKCMQMLKALEQHTYSSRRLWDVLNGLISVGELPQPGGSHFTSLGKPTIGTLIGAAFARDAANDSWGPIVRADASAPEPADDPRKDGLSPYYYSNPQTNGTSPGTSSSSNSSRMPAPYDTANGDFPMDLSFALPLHTEDLGRIPFHHGFSSQFSAGAPAPQQQPHFAAQMQQQQQQQTEGMIGNAFGPVSSEMSLADYSQLLAAMSLPNPAPLGSNIQQIQPQPLEQPAAAGTGADTDVSMMFEDNMVEMWSSAPTSLEWSEWGAYLTTMSGVDVPFDLSRQGM